MNKYGFSLSEVLITLAIMGVVAIISLSQMFQSYSEKVTVTKVKRMYSQLERAFDMYLIENNPEYFYMSDTSSKDAYDKIIKPYFQVEYYAGNNTSKKQKIMTVYYNVDGTSGRYDFSSDSNIYAAKLKDGGTLMIRGYVKLKDDGTPVNIYTDSTSRFQILYDINGKKGPNNHGKDLFSFLAIDRDLMGGIDCNRSSCIENCAKKNSNGRTCTEWIIEKGNMKYLHCKSGIDKDTENCL